MAAGVSRRQRIPRLVPHLRLAARLHIPPPAATTVTAATCPASSKKHALSHTHAHTGALAYNSSQSAVSHSRALEGLLPRALLHQLSGCLKHPHPQSLHHPLTASPARPPAPLLHQSSSSLLNPFSCVCVCVSSLALGLLCRVRSSPLKQSPGYQVDLVVQLVWVSGEPPQQITSLALNSSSGL